MRSRSMSAARAPTTRSSLDLAFKQFGSLMTTTTLLGPDPGGPVVDGRRTRGK